MAEGLELADEVAGLAGGVEMALVPVGAEFLVAGVGVVDQVPGDDEYRAGDGDQGFGVAAAFDDAPVAGAEEGVGAGGGVGGLAEGALEPGVALVRPGRRCSSRRTGWCGGTVSPRRRGVRGWGSGSCPAPISARMICAVVGPTPGICVQAFGQRAVLGISGALAGARVVLRGGHLFQACGRCSRSSSLDLGGEVVDGAQQHPAADGRGGPRTARSGPRPGRPCFLDQAAFGEVREDAGVALAGDQGIEHGPPGHAEEVRDDGGQFDLRVLQEPCPLAACGGCAPGRTPCGCG